MRLPRIRIHVRHDFPHPREVVYAWMTDYQDDDPERAQQTLRRRRVVERSASRVVLEEELELGGVVGRGVFEVDLDPPGHWVARIVRGSGRGSMHDYRLVPSARGCRLLVRYGIQTRRLRAFVRVMLSRRGLRREFEAMWAQLARSLDAELDAAASR